MDKMATMATTNDAARSWGVSATRARTIIDALAQTGRLTVLRTLSGTRLIPSVDVERIAAERAVWRDGGGGGGAGATHT